jgi:hypothetical protein
MGQSTQYHRPAGDRALAPRAHNVAALAPRKYTALEGLQRSLRVLTRRAASAGDADPRGGAVSCCQPSGTRLAARTRGIQRHSVEARP